MDRRPRAASGQRPPFPWPALSLGLAVLASTLLLLAPLSTRVEVTSSAGSPGAGSTSKTVATRISLLDEEGPGVAVVLAVPVVLAGAGWALARGGRRRGAAFLTGLALTGWVVVALASVGLFYLPSAASMLMATRGRPSAPRGAGP